MKNNKILLTIPLITTPFFLSSCTNKDIEKIGKEVGNRVNGENQILIEKLNKIIDEQRKKLELLKKKYYDEYLKEDIKEIENTQTKKLLNEILNEMQKNTKDYEKINKKLVELENEKIMEKVREWGVENLIGTNKQHIQELKDKEKELKNREIKIISKEVEQRKTKEKYQTIKEEKQDLLKKIKKLEEENKHLFEQVKYWQDKKIR